MNACSKIPVIQNQKLDKPLSGPWLPLTESRVNGWEMARESGKILERLVNVFSVH